METGTAGAGAGTETGSESGAEGAAAAPEDGANALLEEFRTFRGDVTSRFEQLDQRLPRQEPEGPEVEDEEPDPLDPAQFSDDDFTDDGALTPEAQQRALQQMIERGVQAALKPQQEAAAQQRRDDYADALEERYPELQDEKVQDEMLLKTQEFAKALGRPELAQEPQLLEMVYLAETMRTRQGDEVPAGSTQGVTLERGGPAGPAAQRQQEDDGDRIVGLAKKSKFRLGTG